MNEEELIALLYPDQKTSQLDDCAYLTGDNDVYPIHTSDAICEDTHFRLDWSSASDIATKLVESNVSDLTSSAAKPRVAFLNMGFSPNTSDDFKKEFINQLLIKFKEYNIRLMGGDTFRSKGLIFSLHLMGQFAWQNYPSGIQRKDGQAGNDFYVTGHLGASRAGLLLLDKKMELGDQQLSCQCIRRHLRPLSRYDLAEQLFNQTGITAMMDLSDGLLEDAGKLARAGDLSIYIDLDLVPVFPGLEKVLGDQDLLCSGEELELLFLANQNRPYPDSKKIGRAVAFDGKSVRLFRNGQEIGRSFTGFRHF